jgi:hypothetical protein
MRAIEQKSKKLADFTSRDLFHNYGFYSSTVSVNSRIYSLVSFGRPLVRCWLAIVRQQNRLDKYRNVGYSIGRRPPYTVCYTLHSLFIHNAENSLISRRILFVSNSGCMSSIRYHTAFAVAYRPQ